MKPATQDGVELLVGVTIELDPETLQPKGTGLIWLSFADGERPAGQQFLGACLVTGSDVVSGACEAHRLGINPGGEVVGLVVSPRPGDRERFAKWTNRLLSRAECEAMDREFD